MIIEIEYTYPVVNSAYIANGLANKLNPNTASKAGISTINQIMITHGKTVTINDYTLSGS